MDKLRNAYATRDERPWLVQLGVWLGMLAICSPAGVAAILIGVASGNPIRTIEQTSGAFGAFVLVTFGAWALASMTSVAANPQFNPNRPDVNEFAKGLALAPLWIIASGVRLIISLFIGAGIAGLLLIGIRAL
jgi:hypothetical protein